MEMIKNTTELIKEKFEAWDMPLGPFREIDDILNDMTRFAGYLGDEHADEFIKCIIWMIENDYPHLNSVYMFVDIYSQRYGKSIAAALMKYITSKGPILLVELLGSTKDEQATDFIMKTIDLMSAEDELLIACISTIGETGGNNALKVLQNIAQKRGNKLSKQAMEELEIALHNNKKNE
ncbi:MAG TPA: hypothetical protein VHY08_02865 [Bacillota bacterium]|nr:hypothetical protein [Bacillota bacterium]